MLANLPSSNLAEGPVNSCQYNAQCPLWKKLRIMVSVSYTLGEIRANKTPLDWLYKHKPTTKDSCIVKS